MSFGSKRFGSGPFGTRTQTVGTPAVPVLLNVTPSDLSVIAPLDTISFDVIVPGLVRRILVCVKYAATDGHVELAFDGSQFRAGYGGSIVAVLGSTVRHFDLRHSGGGWPSRPSLIVFAFDRTGQEL